MKHRRSLYSMLVVGIVFLVALLLTQYMLREDRTITLPTRTAETETGSDKSDAEDLNILSITPSTVQVAISTLSRPASYQRTQTVTLYWSSGESTTTAQVTVSGSVTRIDTTLKDGTVCHTLLSGETACVWYDEDTAWVSMCADQFSSDALQRMPTYESVLDLDSALITQAEYCLKDGVHCIYVQTAPDADGYAQSFWISAQSGLLYAAERTHNGTVIYRFSATEPESDPPSESLFLLPDGSLFPAQ